MRILSWLLASVGLVAANAATAQTPEPAAAAAVQVTPGATVYDASGGALGKIDSVAGGDAIVDTGLNKIAIPLASFGAGANGPVLAATKAQLDGAASQAAADSKAALMAKLVPGAEVRGQTGATVIGSIKSVAGDLVLVTTPNGDVNVPVTSFKPSPTGLLLQMSAENFNKAVAATKG